MRNKTLFSTFFCFFLVLPLFIVTPDAKSADKAQDAKTIVLPVPKTSGGKALMDALAQRRAEREFESTSISPQELSNLLWATWGINRPDGRRTAPTAKNLQELAVYVARADGVWRYDAAANSLVLATDQDVRGKLGDPPLALLYAAPKEDIFAAMHVGSLYQNAGLYCASVGLGNVVKRVAPDALTNAEPPLPEGYKIYIMQAVGWPKKTNTRQ